MGYKEGYVNWNTERERERERLKPKPCPVTCVSGSSEPMLVAPSLTTSVSWVIVLAEEWAAWASFSWLEAAPATSILVSSTKALAVFRMLSLVGGRGRENRTP